MSRALYTDRGGHYFHTPVAGGKVAREQPTQVGRALIELGIEPIPAYAPEARGRSERAFRTLQDRLVKELALAGITSLTPAGHWSSCPSHRHDEDDYSRITYLEETYYHRLNPKDGFGIQRVYTDDGLLDETMAVADGDVTLVPRGHHPCGAP